jgi:hypothetical protein
MFTAQQEAGQTGNSIGSTKKPYLCNFAKVYNLEVGSRLSVRSGPGKRFDRIDSLEAGRSVYICDEQGDWLKIFYVDLESPCGSEFPVGIDVCKVAPCKSGWVNREWIDVISG